MADPFDAIPAGDAEALAERLARRAVDAGLVDVRVRTIDTRLGTLLLAATPRGLVTVAFHGDEPDATLERLADRLGTRVLRDERGLDGVAREVEALADGRARTFDGALDLTLATGFRGAVVRALRDIPYGETRSYGDVARAIGSPGAVRAVGTACRLNPLPIVIPCHRVVRSDGSLGQYAGGVEAKRMLLGAEGALAG
ncbi:methylated-DNA--[protein]-cysteine S-methyltransferase [Agrococcus sp. SGAir0287]|uniref:methylated-DNA--[protein]-cysteine S-methyltransferase n=1 Tax=Agrococcus sp. SGAir0287 TaxID=2070347 RepID=UPI001C2F1950|nr:methylated-DNA--[protein]-cysteine S-methyltransferase [Agrococcus sp. SGAir0287]